MGTESIAAVNEESCLGERFFVEAITHLYEFKDRGFKDAIDFADFVIQIRAIHKIPTSPIL